MDIAKKLGNVLKTYSNNYSGGEDPTVVYFYEILKTLPSNVVHTALDEYYLFPPSQFYDQGYLVKLIQKHLALSLGHATGQQVWMLLQNKIREHGSRRSPDVDDLIKDVIEYFGGWPRFVDNCQERDFLRVYDQFIHEKTKGVILNATNQVD